MRIARWWALLILPAGILPAATGYYKHNLVSDQAGVADFTDPNLVNAWGLATSLTSPFWVCDAGTGLSTVYSASNTPGAALGTPATLKPSIPGAGGSPGGVCTGIVSNPAGSSFLFTSTTNATPRAASFIFATEDGTISAWANAIDPAHAILMVDNSSKAVYKGLAILTEPAPQIYAANFKTGTIDVFDANFKPVTPAAGFADPAIPAGFAPFNIWALNGQLYVTYAKQDYAQKYDVPGAGNGFVSVFDYSGKLLQHLISQGSLNSPWGVAIAPTAFGKYATNLLIGNFGDGLINAFDISSGMYMGTLQDASGANLVIPGLWALLAGNGGSGGDKQSVFFTAGPGGLQHGLLGSIQANPVLQTAQIVNAAQALGAITANEYVTITGSSLAATKRSWQSSDFAGNQLNTSLDNVTVTMNGEPAFISFISPAQINVLTPTDMARSGTIQVVITNNGLASPTINVQAQPVGPAFFLFNSDKYIAATHSDNRSLVGPTTLIPNATTPAKPGETIVLYANGLGGTNPPVSNGQIVTAPLALAATPRVTFNDIPADVQYAGLTASGLYQLNVTVPNGLPDGDASVIVQVNAMMSPAGAFITVQH
jgi:uncharacterized protein (TIGR03118 family)